MLCSSDVLKSHSRLLPQSCQQLDTSEQARIYVATDKQSQRLYAYIIALVVCV